MANYNISQAATLADVVAGALHDELLHTSDPTALGQSVAEALGQAGYPAGLAAAASIGGGGADEDFIKLVADVKNAAAFENLVFRCKTQISDREREDANDSFRSAAVNIDFQFLAKFLSSAAASIPVVEQPTDFVQIGWCSPYGIVPGGMDNAPASNWQPIYTRKAPPADENR